MARLGRSQPFKPIRNIFVPSAGTTTHAGTGALTSQSATIAGTSANVKKHAASGALSAQAATLAGTSAHIAKHAATGVLVAQVGTIAGAADHAAGAVHAATGVLAAQSATISGTSAHIAKHAATGVLVAQAATLAGTSAHIAKHDASGSLVSSRSSVSGIGLNGTVVIVPPATGGGGIGHGGKKAKYKTKKQHVWLVEIDDKEYEVDDLEEIQPIVAKKLAKGNRPKVIAKPLVESPRQVAEVYTQQAWLTQYIPIPTYEKRMSFVDILPYIIAMQEMEEEEETLLLLAA